MKKFRLLVMALLLMPFLSCNPIEYDMFGSVEGVVLDYETNEPIEYVSVQLSPGGMNATSSADGKFTFSDLDSGQYSLTVQKNAYETNIKTINVVASETTQVTITMKKKNY